jgi:hypothetical protein
MTDQELERGAGSNLSRTAAGEETWYGTAWAMA